MFILKIEEFLGISFLCLDVDGVPDEDETRAWHTTTAMNNHEERQEVDPGHFA